jgi:hypothetical protein
VPVIAGAAVMLAGLALVGCAESDLSLEHAEKLTAATAARHMAAERL